MGNACTRAEGSHQGGTQATASPTAAKGAPYTQNTHDTSQGRLPAFRPLGSAHNGRPIQAICNGGDGTILTGGDDREVVLTDWLNGRQLYRWKGHTGTVNRLAFSPDSKLAFSGARDQLIHAWRVDQDTPVLKLEGHTLTVTGLDVCDKEGAVASGSRDYTVRVWDIATGAQRDVRSVSRNVVTFIRWCPGEPCFAQASEDLQVRLWDVRTMEATQSFTGHVNIPQSCDASADGNYLLSCSNGFDGAGCEVFLWDRRKGAMLRRYSGHMQSVNTCAFLNGRGSGEDRLLFATGSTDQTVRTWSAQGEGDTDANSLAVVDAGEKGPDSTPVTCMARVTGGEQGTGETSRFRDILAAVNFGGGIKVWGVHGDGRKNGKAEEGDLHMLRSTP